MELKAPNVLKADDYEQTKTLGAGAFGRVRLASHKSSGRYVAIKTLKKFELIRTKQVDHVLSENSILASIDHPLLVSMDGYFQDERYLYLVLELVQGGELFTYLRGSGRFLAPQASFYAAQVTMMFEYLHSKNVVYRDLKPENILIANDGYLKLTDFGFAKIVEGRTYTLCGTPEYICPEILLNKGHSKAVDWWTLGILIYELIAGIDPFTDSDPMNIYRKVLSGRIVYPKGFDKNAKSLVKHLVVADLSKRYGNLKNKAQDVKNHRFFDNINFNMCLQKKISAPYKPVVKSQGDTSYFQAMPDEVEIAQKVPKDQDPFQKW